MERIGTTWSALAPGSFAGRYFRGPADVWIERAWQWCIRTIRDFRLSVERGRPITPPNLERLFARRWNALAIVKNIPFMERYRREQAGRRMGRIIARRGRWIGRAGLEHLFCR